MAKKGSSVFISYAHQDRKYVDVLSHALEAKGVAVWTESQIQAGAVWEDEIKKALDASEVVIVLLSPHSLSSQWQNFEMGMAIGRAAETPSKRIIPVLVAGVDWQSVPAFMRNRQAVDARNLSAEQISNTLLKVVGTPDAAADDESSVYQ